MLEFLIAQLGLATAAGVCVLALTFGSDREKAAAGICLIGCAAGMFVPSQEGQTLWLRHIVLDGAVLISLLTLVWKAPHPWPLWACGFQLLAVMAAVTTLRNPELGYPSFLLLRGIVSAGLTVCLVWGIVIAFRQNHPRRVGQKSDL